MARHTAAMTARSEATYNVRRGEWTPDLVREHLPDCLVILAGDEIVTGRVSGRALPFARVGPASIGFSVDVAWATVAHCLNVGVPVDLR